MIIAQITHQPEIENSPRRRVLDHWHVKSYLGNDGTTKIHYLAGQTVREVDGFEPPCRITNTSPIASQKGNIVTTASGSKYTLGIPLAGQALTLTEEQLNPWLNEKNWLTI